MTRSERFIKDRAWLKVHRFAITNSLKNHLAEATYLSDWDREYLCYIQNKVLRETRKTPDLYANIGAKYWEDKCGGGYGRYIRQLEDWGELLVNYSYRVTTESKKGFPMSYMVPFVVWESGVTVVDFKRRASAIKDHTDWSKADDIVRHVHGCCSRLTVPKTLIEVTDPIRDSAAHEFSRRVYWGDFNIRYGDSGRRMFHSIIEMPKTARANLVCKEGGPPLFEYDIKSCHPVLLLPLFSDPLEKEKYSLLLDNDIYSTIRDAMGIAEDRAGIKIQFMVCTNSTDRYVGGKRGLIYQFFQEYFPVFTREVLDIRSDLAAYLQQQESQIMVQGLGRLSLEKNLFWIPCHDGWLGTEEGEGEIIKKVAEAFYQATGYRVRIEKTPLQNISTYTSRSIILGEGCVYGSYVRIEPTIPPSDYRKSAEEWFTALPKHPKPDAETEKKWQEARQNRKLAFRDHGRRGREAAKLRRLAPRARPLWDQLMGGGKVGKAA